MLIDAIIGIFVTLSGGLIRLLPDMQGLPPQIDTALTYIGGTYGQWMSIFPALATYLVVFGIVISIETAIFTWHGIDWTLNKIRGSG